jgi:outer membrane protein assembly factor BamB
MVNQLLMENPEDSDVLLLKSLTYESMDNFDLAYGSILIAEKKSPNNTQIIETEGRIIKNLKEPISWDDDFSNSEIGDEYLYYSRLLQKLIFDKRDEYYQINILKNGSFLLYIQRDSSGSGSTRLILADKSGTEIASSTIERMGHFSSSTNGNVICVVVRSGITIFDSNLSIKRSKNFSDDPDEKIDSYTTNVDVSDDGKYIGVSGPDCRLFDSNGNELWRNPTLNAGYGGDIAVSNEAKRIVISTGKGLYVFDKNGNKLWEYSPIFLDYLRECEIASDGSYILTYNDRDLIFIDQEGREKWKKSFKRDIECISKSPDDQYISIITCRGQGFVYNKEGIELLRIGMPPGNGGSHIALSEHAEKIVIGNSNHIFYLNGITKPNPVPNNNKMDFSGTIDIIVFLLLVGILIFIINQHYKKK